MADTGEIHRAPLLERIAALEAENERLQGRVEELVEERKRADALEAERDFYRDAIAEAGVELYDERLSYVTLQFDREIWEATRARLVATESPEEEP